MPETFYIKDSNTSPTITQTLKDAAGVGVVLSGASVRIHVNNRRGTNVVDAAATIVTAASGIVSYTFAALDNGAYEYEFEVTYADSTIETFPNTLYDILLVDRKLA